MKNEDTKTTEESTVQAESDSVQRLVMRDEFAHSMRNLEAGDSVVLKNGDIQTIRRIHLLSEAVGKDESFRWCRHWLDIEHEAIRYPDDRYEIEKVILA
jgi:hypothetical protein